MYLLDLYIQSSKTIGKKQLIHLQKYKVIQKRFDKCKKYYV